MAEDECLQSAISSIFGEIPEEDRPALGKLGSLKQAVSDAVEAEKRSSLHRQHEENLRMLPQLAAEARAKNDRVKSLKIEKAKAKTEADSARALVKELKV